MASRLNRYLSLAIVVSIIVTPLNLLAGPPTGVVSAVSNVIVVPVRDANADRGSEDLASALREALVRQGGFHVIDARTVDAILQYHRPGSDITDNINDGDVDKVRALINDAKAKYLKFDNKGALAAARKAVFVADAAMAHSAVDGRSSHTAGAEAVEARLTLAMACHAAGDASCVRASLGEMAKIAPFYVPDPVNYPPSIVKTFSEERAALARAGVGSISVESAPPVAQVLLNGIDAGVTPVKLNGVPPGKYRVRVSANNYHAFDGEINVAVGRTATLKQKLKWDRADVKGVDTSATIDNEDARAQLHEGVRIAGLNKADHVVAVDVDETSDGSGSIIVRTIDAQYKTGRVPIRINFGKTRNDLHKNLAKMTALVAEQLRKSPMDDPQRMTDPVGEGDPVLLGSRKRRISPVIWGSVGAGVLGGILAAMFAARSGGAPATGAVSVSFK